MPYQCMETTKRLVVGCMTGTSIDGLDTALVEVEGSGLEITCSVRRCLSEPLGELGRKLRLISRRLPVTARELAMITDDLANLHLGVLRELIDGERVDFVCVHGQTVFHAPPLSLQIINPSPIAFGLGVPVVTDLRAADLACGGQGAPITPLADFVMYRSLAERLCVVNLGGFSNITILPEGSSDIPSDGMQSHIAEIGGQDVCACNQILDALSTELFTTPYDVDGKRAAGGKVCHDAFCSLELHLKGQSMNGRSLGTGDDISTSWIKRYREMATPEDLCRTACAAIASTIVSRRGKSDRMILAGGGAKNKTLVMEIAARADIQVDISDDFGIPSVYREAVAMGVLGAMCQDRVPITLPQITGASSDSISGIWVLP